MRNLQIATVGETAAPIKEGINAYRTDDLYLLFDEKTKNNAIEIRKLAEELNIKCSLVEIIQFDMEDIFLHIIKIAKKNPNHNIIINVTGGTKIMSNAAFIAGYLLHANVFYIREDKENKGVPLQERVYELPVPSIQIENLDVKQISILKFILDNNGKIEKGTSQISNGLKLSPQLVSYHILKLEGGNLVKTEKTGRNNIISLTSAGRFVARYFEEK